MSKHTQGVTISPRSIDKRCAHCCRTVTVRLVTSVPNNHPGPCLGHALIYICPRCESSPKKP